MPRWASCHQMDSARSIVEAHAGALRIALIADSFLRLTGETLVPPNMSPADALWHLPAVVVAHGTEADPVFFYANRMALDLFGFTANEFICLPSRLSAEPLAREERARLLTQVAAKGFIADYTGVRIARSGRRFTIEQATVWNLQDGHGSMQGQAACFAQWIPLD